MGVARSVRCEAVMEEEQVVNIRKVRQAKAGWEWEERTGPDPKLMGEAPDTQLMAKSTPSGSAYILQMGPDTGAGVTLIPLAEAEQDGDKHMGEGALPAQGCL